MTTGILAVAIGIACWMALGFKDWKRKLEKRKQKLDEPISSDSNSLPDYRTYVLSPKERLTTVVSAGLLLAAIGYLFYGSAAAAAMALPGGFALLGLRARMLNRRRKNELRVQFKQALQAVSSSLGAGKSIELAFVDAVQDMRMLYPEGTSLMIRELEILLRKIRLGGTIETAIADFGRRSGLEDAGHFADVFTICKRTGGNVVEIVRRTASIIGEKLEIEQEIAVHLAQKRFESRVLLAAPLVIVAILRLTAMDYMAPLYSGSGRGTMTAALAALLGCFWLTTKLMRIRI